MVSFLTLVIALLQPPPAAPPPFAPSLSFEHVKQSVAVLSKSPSAEAKQLAQKIGTDIATMETLARRDTYVPSVFLDELDDNAKALGDLASRPSLDEAGLTALRGLADDFRVQAQAASAPIAPPPPPPPPPVIAQAPRPYPQPRTMPMPPVPRKAMPPAPSKTLPESGGGGGGGSPTAQGPPPSRAGLEAPLPPPRPREEVHPEGDFRLVKAVEEVRDRLVSAYIARLPYPQVPAKSIPTAAAPIASAGRWLRAIRVQTMKAGQELFGLTIYYIGKGRASDRFPSRDLKPLGLSRLEDSIPWGNYLMIAVRGELPEIVERRMLKPMPIRLESTGAAVLPIVLEVE
jgi:hypothetical protein